MTEKLLESILDILDVLLTAGMAVGAAFLINRARRPLAAVCFMAAMASLLLTNAYWLAHSLLRPDMRIPLAADVIGECAVFLLLSAAMNAIFSEKNNEISVTKSLTIITI